MSTAIYDSSMLTRLRMNKAQAGDFLNRLNNAQPGYTPRLGIYDQSIITTIKDGIMKHYRKQDTGVTTVINGCPCAPLSGGDAVYGTN